MKKKVLLVLVLCFVCFISACKKKEVEPKSPFETQLPTDAMVSVTENEVTLPGAVSTETKTPENLEPISIADDTSDYIAPTPPQVQEALKKAGYYTGEIDGIIGSKSKEAIMKFQKDNGLVDDGKVGPKTWSKLRQYLKQGPVVND